MSAVQRRRILMVATVCGTLRGFLLPYAQHLREKGWEVEAACSAGTSAASLAQDFDRSWPMPWSRNVASPGNAAAITRMRRLLSTRRYDVVHVHTPVAAFATRVAAGSLGARRPAVVYTAHGFHFIEGGDPRKNAIYAAAERFAGRWTDRLIVITEEDAAQATTRRVVPPSKLVHLPGVGIDPGYYAPTDSLRERAARFRRERGVSATAAVYAMVAEFQPGKNHTAAVAAFARLPYAEKHLLLAGTGPFERRVAELVSEHGLEGSVHFLGFVEDVRPVVLAADATVLPSRREGLSRAVLESLALGIPVVGANRRGIRQLVDPDVGILVEPDDVEALSRALVDVRSISAAGGLRERYLARLERYSLDALLARHDELYEELLRQRSRGPIGTEPAASEPT